MVGVSSSTVIFSLISLKLRETAAGCRPLQYTRALGAILAGSISSLSGSVCTGR